MEGLRTVIERGRLMACMHPLSDEQAEAMVAAWYEAIIGDIPCQYWKDVGLWVSRYTDPPEAFTIRQFYQAWTKFCEQGRARGYEIWR